LTRREPMTNAIPQSVHLVGSIGLDNVPEIFRTLGKGLGRRLKRVPDDARVSKERC
jgi:hypothetical protein